MKILKKTQQNSYKAKSPQTCNVTGNTRKANANFQGCSEVRGWSCFSAGVRCSREKREAPLLHAPGPEEVREEEMGQKEILQAELPSKMSL